MSFVNLQQNPGLLVIGDGQLARMMLGPAIELELPLRVFAVDAAQSASSVWRDVALGDYRDAAAVVSAAAGVGVATFEHEHVPNDVLESLIDAHVAVRPDPAALIFAQDKLLMREKLSGLGFPVPEFAAIESTQDAVEFFKRVDGAVCLKTRRGGYDGKGVWFPKSEQEFVDLVVQLLASGQTLVAEAKVTLVRELSALVARSPRGEVAAWDIAESVQNNGVCVIAQAPVATEVAARVGDVGSKVAEALGVTGVLAVELMEDASGKIVINELAMRPHNTGHWTQDGSVTSQFEQHLRAVMDLPLGSTTMTAPTVVMANILGGPEEPASSQQERMAEVWRVIPAAKIHFYGKTWRPGRKLGHVNLQGTDPETTRAEALAAAHYLVHGRWPADFPLN